MSARELRPTRRPARPARRASEELEALVAAQARELESANTRLRALIDNQPECVKLFDARGRLIEMNAAGLEMIEADDPSQVLGELVYGLVVPEHREAFRDLTERVCRGERGTLKFEIVGLKGARRWLETRAVPFYDDARGSTVLLGITRDITEQKRAEQARHESEARFRSLVELSSDWYWEQDENCRFVAGSAGIQAIAELSVAADLGKTRWELPLVGPSQEQWDEHRATLAARRPFRDFEYQRLNELGRPVWISVSGEPIFDAEGRFRGYRGVGRNITQRKLADQALRASEQRFQLFMDNSPALAWIKDSRLRYTWINQTHERTRGRLLSDVAGKDDFEVRPADEAARIREQDKEVLRLGTPMQYMNDVSVPGDGTRSYLVIRFPLTDADGASGIGGIAVDVSESVRLERALRESEQRFRLFMENAPALTWTKDADRRMTSINREYERARSTTQGAVFGRGDFDLHPPEIARRIMLQDDAVLRSRQPMQYLNTVPNADGTQSTYLVVRFPVPDAQGKMGIGGIAVDVTEKYQLAKTVRDLHHRLVGAQEVERRKIAGDLHDLIGQKLTALGLNVDIVRQELHDAIRNSMEPRLRQMSALLDETIGTIREVMSELRPPALEEHGLSAALFQYASMFEARTGLRIQVTGSKQNVPLPREIAISLFRIAQEALTNAAKHSGASCVRIKIVKDPQRVELCVEDDGHGVPNPAGAHTGIAGGWGLPAMRERAEAVGGQLSIENTGKGTRVTARVPLIQGEALPSA